MLFFLREATSQIYGPGSLLYHISLRDLFSFFFLDLYYRNPKNISLNFFAFICIYQSTRILSCQLDNFWHHYPKGIDNPFNTSGCKYLFFVCRYRLRSVAWFSYWLHNLCLITEGNTYRRCVVSSLPLWVNTDVVQAASKGISGAVARETSSTPTRYLITNLISLQFTLFPICRSFSSPHFTKFAVFVRPLFRSSFSHQISYLHELVTMSNFGMAETDDGLTPKIGRSGNLDAKTFILGQGNIMRKEHIQEFFNCV
ncbi:hypothetical protein VPH35_039943 [Triticum aestivum]